MNHFTHPYTQALGVRRTGQYGSSRHQRGMSLVIALILMLAVLLIGVGALSVNSMQERMLGNSKDQELAYQAAEAGLRDAEQFIQNVASDYSPSTDCSTYMCTPPSKYSTPNAAPVYASTNAGWSKAITYASSPSTATTAFPLVKNQPQYLIEKFASIPGSMIPGNSAAMGGVSGYSSTATVYRISVLATGARPETTVILQSMFAIKN